MYTIYSKTFASYFIFEGLWKQSGKIIHMLHADINYKSVIDTVILGNDWNMNKLMVRLLNHHGVK